LFGFGRPTLPFPHLWNYKNPIKIFETFYWGAEREAGSGKHNRYIYVAGMPPVLLTREPAVIKAVQANTGDKPGQFDRDTSPTAGIARATGEDSLLYSNGSVWRRQKRLSAEPFSRSNLFQPEKFHGFEQTFRETVAKRLEALRSRQLATGKKTVRHCGRGCRIYFGSSLFLSLPRRQLLLAVGRVLILEDVTTLTGLCHEIDRGKTF
jgi:hypothetical protein